MKVVHVVGTRPNFMKASSVLAALRDNPGVHQVLIHTGQHYELNMSDIFFRQLDIPAPDLNLDVGSGTHAEQTAKVMLSLESVLLEKSPDLVFVYGDVNSTLAAALVCAKSHIPLAHVEAGLRSFDRRMPEEINRLVTDQMADFLFTSCKDADDNLKQEGISPKNIHFVGNVMIDTLVRLLPEAQVRWDTLKKKLRIGEYALVTLHRPSNVDYTEVLSNLVTTLVKMSNDIPIIFPAHPRTRMRISEYQLDFPEHRFRLLDPLGYLEFIALELHANVVITDSGGIQEETTYLGIPCLTVRETTERPVTINMGTNVLVGHDTDRLIQEVEAILNGVSKKGKIPPLWDGHASERIASIIA